MTERLLTAGEVGERLPELLDTRKLQVELGITRAAAEKIMRRLPVVQIEDLRVYVRRSDVARSSRRGPSPSTKYHREPGRALLDSLDQTPPGFAPMYPLGV